MNYKITIPIVIAFILLVGFISYIVISGNLEETAFDRLSYNYTSSVWIPPNSPKVGSLGGFYNIQGQGRNFNFHIVLPGAETTESPLDYTKEGLDGNGRIKSIEVTSNTVMALLSGDFKKAMFETKYSGDFNMNCAAWTGLGTFSSDNETVHGTFKIYGQKTYWDGTFDVKIENNRIVLIMNYIYYPNKNPKKAKKVQETIYM